MVRSLALLALVGLFATPSLACTTLAAGKLATADGSTLSSHSDDGRTDPRLIYVPSTTHSAGEVRNIYFDTEGYPRYIGYDRGPAYYPKEDEKAYTPIGTIPQIVGTTYSRTEGTYGIMNSEGVGMSESTCSGIFSASAIGYGGKALLSIDELSRIGLERCNTARCAVQLMGDLAVQYGFYGADSGTEGGSESLLVHDADEVFIFHILPDDTGTSAIWVAQRVPDDHIAVVANMFTVRDVDLSDTVNFLGSNNMFSIAEKHNLWNSSSKKLLDFTGVFSDGEYGHRYYSGRRMWGAFNQLSPKFAAPLPDTYINLKKQRVYPATLQASQLLTPQDFFTTHRSYYEGTKYDQTVGLAAGPFGLPDRFSTSTKLKGNWERTISIARTSYTHVKQIRKVGTPVPSTLVEDDEEEEQGNNSTAATLSKLQNAIVWFGPHVAATTVFVPYTNGVSSVAPSLSVTNRSRLSRDSLWWGNRYLYNLRRIKTAPMQKDIAKLQAQLEQQGLDLVKQMDAAVGTTIVTADQLSQQYNDFVEKTVTPAVWALTDALMEKYADSEDGISYPDWWLTAVGYQNGPPDH